MKEGIDLFISQIKFSQEIILMSLFLQEHMINFIQECILVT